MKLNILDRIMAIQALNNYGQGNFITYKTILSLKAKLFVNEEETKKYDLHIENNDYKWNPLGFNEYVEIDINDTEKKLILDQLMLMDKKNELVFPQHEHLCELLFPSDYKHEEIAE